MILLACGDVPRSLKRFERLNCEDYMARGSDAWELGFADGEAKAINCCFGWTQPYRSFDTAEEEQDYLDGFESGYESVD